MFRRLPQSTPGAIAADVTIGFVLQGDRAARMVAQSVVDSTLPGLSEVVEKRTLRVSDGFCAFVSPSWRSGE